MFVFLSIILFWKDGMCLQANVFINIVKYEIYILHFADVNNFYHFQWGKKLLLSLSFSFFALNDCYLPCYFRFFMGISLLINSKFPWNNNMQTYMPHFLEHVQWANSQSTHGRLGQDPQRKAEKTVQQVGSHCIETSSKSILFELLAI